MLTPKDILTAVTDPVELPKAILDLVNQPHIRDRTAGPGTHSIDMAPIAPGRTISIYRPTRDCGYRVVGLWENGECLSFNLVHDVPCTCCSKQAVWLVNLMPYCKYHAPMRVEEVIRTEGIVSRFFCHLGFVLRLGRYEPRTTPLYNPKGE